LLTNLKQNKIATNNAVTTNKPKRNQKDLQGETFLVEKILAKGWMAHLGSGGKGNDREREWCYLIQWAKSEGGKSWEPTWEPLSTMYDGSYKQKMAELFEDRMKDKDSEGAPDWADVLVSLEESPFEDIC
jgi:hypothetical protein